MRVNGFLMEVNEYFKVEIHRLIKISTGLRKLEFLPDGRSKEDITPIQAAHLIRTLALNLNPVAGGFAENVLDGCATSVEDGRILVEDLAHILESHGLCPYKKKEQFFVEKILFSLDRNFAMVILSVDENVIREKHYGDKKELPFEKFAVLQKEVIMDLMKHFELK